MRFENNETLENNNDNSYIVMNGKKVYKDGKSELEHSFKNNVNVTYRIHGRKVSKEEFDNEFKKVKIFFVIAVLIIIFTIIYVTVCTIKEENEYKKSLETVYMLDE